MLEQAWLSISLNQSMMLLKLTLLVILLEAMCLQAASHRRASLRSKIHEVFNS